MRQIFTKLGIIACLVGSAVLGAAGSSVAQPHRTADVVEQVPYNYTCKLSWFYPGYYCYQADPSDAPGYDAYGTHLSCPAAVWNGRKWVRREIC